MNVPTDIDIAALLVALLRECAAFETGLTDFRKSVLRKQLMILSHGKMSDIEFEDMLGAGSIIEPEGFLPVLRQIKEFMPPTSKMMFRKAFEQILSADGPPSKAATVLIDDIRRTLMY